MTHKEMEQYHKDYVNRIKRIGLTQGDVLHCYPSDGDPILQVGDIYNLYGYKTLVTHVIKESSKKWWQFWIKQKITGYRLEVLRKDV